MNTQSKGQSGKLLAKADTKIKSSTKRPKLKRKGIQYRSDLERDIAHQLEVAGVAFQYEKKEVPYIREGKVHRYHPDFLLAGGVLLEAKGYFHNGEKDRAKLVYVVGQHPALDLRLVFQNERNKIMKGSTMTYADWAEVVGIDWAGAGRVPEEWLEEFRQLQGAAVTGSKGSRGCRTVH